MMVSRSGVDLQSEARLPRELSERVACARSDRPGADILSADYASLAHRLEIPIDMVEIPREPDIEHVALFVTTGVEVAGVVLLVEGVVGRQFVRPEDLPLHPERVEAEMAVRRVVERMLEIVLHRLAQESDEAPGAALPVTPHGIERLPRVGTVAGRDETLQVEVEILPSDPRLEGPRLGRVDVGKKSEPQVEGVLVDGRSTFLPKARSSSNCRFLDHFVGAFFLALRPRRPAPEALARRCEDLGQRVRKMFLVGRVGKR